MIKDTEKIKLDFNKLNRPTDYHHITFWNGDKMVRIDSLCCFYDKEWPKTYRASSESQMLMYHPQAIGSQKSLRISVLSDSKGNGNYFEPENIENRIMTDEQSGD